jgi:hypothetical protein
MKPTDIEEARRLLRVALGACWEAHNIGIAIDKFLAPDENNRIHVQEEDSISLDRLEQLRTDALNTILSVVHEELPELLGVDLMGRDNEISIDREFHLFRANRLVQLAG